MRDCIGYSKWKLDTPCLVIDEDRLRKNIRTLQHHAASFGKQLRPHAKTHKCSRIAGMQMEAGCAGICVAKVSEAEVLVGQGFKGVLITSPIVSDYKIERLLTCLSGDPEIKVVVDNADNAQKLSQECRKRSVTLNVLIDINPGMGRTGTSFNEALEMGRLAESLPALRLAGVQCYAGHVQHIPSFEERRRSSLNWMEQAAEVVRQFRRNGMACDIFTGAGTGTFDIDCRVSEVTDLQVGSYTMMDAEYWNIGSSRDPAHFADFPPSLTLLTTVVSANQPDFVTVDAGLKALYHHGGTPFVLHPAEGEFKYEWMGDEHGAIFFKESVSRPHIGDVLELVVSHCDPTVNLFDVLHVTRGGIVTDVWPIDMRGRTQ
jgi:D-serine deaminase-like pyridoxal phosphate-dependent protein